MSILGIAFLLLPIIAGVTAIVTGVMARKQIARSDGAVKGGGMAIAGIVCGSLCLLIAAGFTAFAVLVVAGSNRNAVQTNTSRKVELLPSPAEPSVVPEVPEVGEVEEVPEVPEVEEEDE